MTITNTGEVGLEFRMSAEGCAQLEIPLLREYRTRLIAGEVTGKVDVREAAIALREAVEADDLDEANEEDGA